MNDGNISQSEYFLVKKPASNSSREIRDAILRENFGYTEQEIKFLDQYDPIYFTVHETGTKDTWATVAQVMKWKTDAQGSVSIPLTQTLIRNLKEFRARIMSVQINYAAGFITDSDLRAGFIESAKELLDPFSSKKYEAINNLILDTSGNTGNAEQIFKALDYLASKSGYQDNSFVTLAKVNAAVTIYRTKIGPGYDIDAQTLLAEVSRLTNKNFNFNAKNGASNISRQEAAFVYRHISFLYNQIGDANTAREKDWLARFYDITETERADVEEGDFIEFISTVKAVGTPRPMTQVEKDLAKLENDEADRRQLDDATDKIGSQIVPTDHRSGELFQKKTDGFETLATRQKKIRQGQSGYKGQHKFVIYKENPYQRANVLSDGYGAALELPVKFSKWVITLRRLDDLAYYLQERDRLQRKIKAENRYIVPPKPETVQKLVRQIQKFGRVTANPNAKIKAQMTLRQLEQVWEESNAFWKDKK